MRSARTTPAAMDHHSKRLTISGGAFEASLPASVEITVMTSFKIWSLLTIFDPSCAPPLFVQIGKYVEAFEDGMSFKNVENKMADMLSRKTKLEARKRAVSK